MNAHDLRSDDTLLSAADRQIDEVCERFKLACGANHDPRIEDFAGDFVGPGRAALLRRLLLIDLEYRRKSGDVPTLKQYRARLPDDYDVILDALNEFTRDGSVTATEETTDGGNSAGSGLHIRCPHCHYPVEIVDDTSFADVTCSSCGSHFSLHDTGMDTRTSAEVATVGHFELVDRLGVGGFGTVWKARDTQLDRTVAIKVPRRGQLEPTETDKFFREARAAAQLKHPNIVSVHEVGRDGDTVYIVSDLVRGVALSDWITAKRMPIREAAQLCVKIADALEHAHEAGVVHRDLKPQNILIDENLEPYLTDFGLAKRESGEITITMDGQLLGTPAYMSPEQASGAAHQADRRTDIYSVGVILFQLIAGELPFRGNTKMLLHQVLHDEPPSPRKFNNSIPRDLETICLKCLEKEPAKRYEVASDVADDLRRFLRQEPIRGRPVSSLARAWRWRKRNRAIASLLLIVCCTLLLGTLVSSLFAVSAFRSERFKIEAIDRLVEVLTTIAGGRTEGYRVKVWDLVGDAGRLGGSDVDRDALRRVAVSAMGDFVGLQPTELTDFPDDVTAIGLHPNAESMAVGLKGGQIHLVNPDGGEVLAELAGHTEPVLGLALGNNGQRLISVDNTAKILFWNRNQDGQWQQGQAQQFVIGEERLDSVLFTPDQTHILARDANQVTVWDLAQATQLAKYETDELVVYGATLSADHRWLAVGYKDDSTSEGGFILRDLTGAEAERRILLQNLGYSSPYSMTFSHDGRFFAYGCEQALVVYDLPGFSQRTMLRSSAIRAVAFSPDSQFLASTDIRGILTLWSVSTGRDIAVLSHSRKRPWFQFVTFSQDGNHLASANLDSIKSWNLAAAKERKVLRGHLEAIPTVAFSPDGKLLATGSKDRTVCLWNPETGQKLHALPAFSGPIQCVTFSPDGKWLVTAHWGPDNPVQIWDVASHELVASANHSLADVNGLVFIGDKRLAACGDEGVMAWNIQSRAVAAGNRTVVLEPFLTREGHRSLDLAVSSDNKYLAWVADDTKIQVWDIEQEKLVPFHPSPMLHGWHGLSFLPGTNDLIFVNSNGVAEIADLARDISLKSLGDSDDFRSPHIALSRDGHWLAGMIEPEAVSVWDTESAKLQFAFRPERAAIWSLAWSNDEKYLALGLADGGLTVLDLDELKSELAKLGLEWTED